MGLFDSLLGLNTNQALNNATTAANNGLSATAQGNAQELINTATSAGNAATTGTNSALASLLSGYGNANGALANYGGQAQGALAGGLGSAVGTLGNSSAGFSPYTTSGSAANTMLANSYGLNGASGTAAAQGAFTASPGYQWQVDQATDAAARKAASLGMAGSGNTLSAITTLGSNLANQEYGNWQAGLSGLSNTGLNAQGQVAANDRTAAGYQYGAGTTGAGLLQQLGQLIGNNDAGLGTQSAAYQNSLGSSLSGIQQNLGTNSVNNNWMGTNGIAKNLLTDGAAADQTQNANNGIFSSLIGKAGNLGLSMLGL